MLSRRSNTINSSTYDNMAFLVQLAKIRNSGVIEKPLNNLLVHQNNTMEVSGATE
jgi:hypothetical protein